MRPSPARLAERLSQARPGDLHVVALPDFFLDHFVTAPAWGEAVALMEGVHARGGGNVPGWPQRFHPGGNATNTALALARLGVRAHLVAITDAFGLAYLRETVAPHGVDVKQVRSTGRLAITTALEFGPDRRNVMLSHPGSLADLRFEDLDDNQLTLVEGSDAVLIANWTANRAAGTPFVESILKLAGGGRALTYLDTGDPSSRLAEVPELKRRVFSSPDLDVLAVNENEARIFSAESDAELGAAKVASEISGTLDLHTGRAAVTWTKEGRAEAPCLDVPMKRATGAGDAWNAGNLLGHLLKLDPAERLLLANVVGGLYVSGEDGLAPRLSDVVACLRSAPRFQP